MQARTDFDDLNVIIRHRNGRYLASVPQVGLYATGDNMVEAIDALEAKKKKLLEELAAADALDEIDTAAKRPIAPMRALPALGLFAAKGIIVLALILAAVGFTRHAVESEISRYTAPKIGGTVFWAKMEAVLARAAEPSSDLPEAKKKALLAELHVLVDRWQPFVREFGRLFSDRNDTPPANP